MTARAHHPNLPAQALRLFVLFFSVVCLGLAGTWTVFGPENFEQGRDSENRRFLVREPDTTYTLRVENGGSNSKLTRASNASIMINGVEVLGKKDFEKGAPILEIRINLRSVNFMSVRVQSPSNAVIRVSIVGVDNEMPSITAGVLPPPNDAGWNRTGVVVGFLCIDKISGIDSCTPPVTLFSNTAGQTVTGTAIDEAKNKNTKAILVKIDRTDPVITATAIPQPNSKGWNNSDVMVTFKATDALSGVASVSGPVTLKNEGDHVTARGTATDVAGNSDTLSLSFKIDKTGPMITINSPKNNSEQSTPSLTVTGMVKDHLSGAASVQCNGSAATLSGSDFKCGVTLAPGPNTVSVVATDLAGNSTTETRSVTYTDTTVSVSVTPETASLYAGQTRQFTANVAVTWTASAGTINNAGLYTAPATIASQQSATITGTSVADPSKNDTATVTLLPAVTVTVSPASATLYAGQTQQFTANVPVTWTASVGSISSGGLYTAPPNVASQQSVTITATSQADNTKTGTAAVTLWPPISVTVTPASATLYGGQTQQFATTVLYAVNTAVTWSASAGTISATGLYTAPANIPTFQNVTVTATSQADNTTAGTATVTLSPAITVTVQPATGSIVSGQSQQFTATVANTPNTGVTWTASAGSITAGGLYTSPANILAQQVVTITATSHADNVTTGTATLTVTPPDSYLHRRSIKIDHTKVPNTDQVNFPILVSGVYSYLAHVSNNGQVIHPNGFDIAFFADAAGTQRLDREIESYDPVTGAISIWVRIPNLSHTCDTVIFMFYGNPAVTADQPNVANTWDAGFAAVYHMSQNGALSMKDSTSNANHCVNHGAISGASLLGGAGGGAASFNGTSDFMDCGNAASLQISAQLTMSAWAINLGNGRIIGKMDTGSRNGYEMFIAPFQGFGNFQHAWVANAGTAGGYTGGGTLFTGSRLQYAMVFTPGQVNVYRDGGLPGGQPNGTAPGSIGNSPSNLGIGYNPGNSGDFFNGPIDEVRISSVARSADWIATEFNNINSPASFYTIGLDHDTPPAACVP